RMHGYPASWICTSVSIPPVDYLWIASARNTRCSKRLTEAGPGWHRNGRGKIRQSAPTIRESENSLTQDSETGRYMGRYAGEHCRRGRSRIHTDMARFG